LEATGDPLHPAQDWSASAVRELSAGTPVPEDTAQRWM
jgi:hypothetical protein